MSKKNELLEIRKFCVDSNELQCDLGFSQDWHGWGRATPLEPCPKPKTEKLYFKCIGKID